MELLQLNIIKDYENIIFKANNLTFDNSINIHKSIDYPFLFKNNNKNYLYYRDNNDPTAIIGEVTKRFEIIDINNVKDDKKYLLNMYYASHNFRFFNFNGKNYGIGGRIHKYDSIYTIDAINQSCKSITDRKILKYFKNHSDNRQYVGNKKYSPERIGQYLPRSDINCPLYSNGLNLFIFHDIDDNDFTEENKGLPIINGFHNGRYDAFCNEDCEYTCLENAKGGVSIFDCNTSIIYNENHKKYYLYQRANIGRGLRHIQYCTSTDMINWSNFELLKLYPEKDYSKTNLYYNNIIKINGINNYIAFIPYTEIDKNKYSNHERNSNNDFNTDLELYYSNDCENWNLIGIVHQHKYYEHWMVLGEPILKDNKYYFFMSNSKELSLETYYIEKDRFSYAMTLDMNKISKISFKNMVFTNEECKIKINFKTFENGYIKIQLKDKENLVIDVYSFDNFNVIGENMDEYNYEISWKNECNYDFKKTEFKIELEGMNFNLYSINCVKIIE